MKNFDLDTKPNFDLDAPYHLQIPLDAIHDISKHVKNDSDALAEDIAILVIQYVSSQIMHLAQYYTHSCDTTKDEYTAIDHTLNALNKTRELLVTSKKKTQSANRQSYRSHLQHNTGQRNRNVSIPIHVLKSLSCVCGTSRLGLGLGLGLVGVFPGRIGRICPRYKFYIRAHVRRICTST
eukprot:scaffold17187_cov40-Cyclotella_meneghiniana.AAC.1